MSSSHEIHEIPSNISMSSENYLEVIYDLAREGCPVRSVDVAKRMGVSKASVNKAVGVLREAGLVEQELYGSIELTADGLKQAKEVTNRHLTIRRFLTEILGVDEETADNDACRMEHVVSEKTMHAWAEYVKKAIDMSK